MKLKIFVKCWWTKKKKNKLFRQIKTANKGNKIFYSYVWQNFEEPSIYELYSRITNDYWDGDKTLKNLKNCIRLKIVIIPLILI